MSDQVSDWTVTGALIDEMDAAGQAVELHRTQSNNPDFAWACAVRSQGDTISLRKWCYGPTPHVAVERAYERWADEAGVGG